MLYLLGYCLGDSIIEISRVQLPSHVQKTLSTPDVMILITIPPPFHQISRTSGVVLCYRHIPWGWELHGQSFPILRYSAVV